MQNNKSRKATTSTNIDYSTYTDEEKDVINTISATTVAKSNFVAPTTFEGFTVDGKGIGDILFASWELQQGSEFIDKGTPISIENYTKDIYGNNRIMGKSIDVGASEFNPATSVTTTKPENEIIKCCYYTPDGRYIGNTRPAISGFYIMKTIDKDMSINVKKVFVK